MIYFNYHFSKEKLVNQLIKKIKPLDNKSKKKKQSINQREIKLKH